MEMEEVSDQRLQVVLVSTGLVQGLRRRMQKLVGQTARELVEHDDFRQTPARRGAPD